MRIGVIVDGESEYRSIGSVLNALQSESFQLVGVARCLGMHHESSIEKQASDAVRTIKSSMATKNPEKVVIVVDFETRAACPGVFALRLSEIVRNLALREDIVYDIELVLKVRTYENWLVADVNNLRQHKAMFVVSNGTRKSIEPNKADQCNGYVILSKCKKACKKGTSYDKKRDSQIIMKTANPLEIAKNSRSFRRLLRVLGVEPYTDQSIDPR